MSKSEPVLTDDLARGYLDLQIESDEMQRRLANYRATLIIRVLRFGFVPTRATKLTVLAGEDYELRVTAHSEITVDTKAALRLKDACTASGNPYIFARLFRRVESFVLADNADRALNQPRLPKHAPRNLRSLFARAIRVKALAHALEVRKRAPDVVANPERKRRISPEAK